MEWIKSWVINLVMLSMIIVLIEMVIPSGRTKKLVKLVSGFILMIAVLNPVLGMFHKGIDLEDLSIRVSNEWDRKELQMNTKQLEEKQTKQIVEVYRSKLTEHIQDSLKDIKGISVLKATVKFNEEYGSGGFGEVTQVLLEVKPGEKKDPGGSAIKIDRVHIGERKASAGVHDDKDEVLRKEIEKRLKETMELSSDKVSVSFIEAEGSI